MGIEEGSLNFNFIIDFDLLKVNVMIVIFKVNDC